MSNRHAVAHTVNPGLAYLIQVSTNLADWMPVATNMATTNPTHFSDDFYSTGERFYPSA